MLRQPFDLTSEAVAELVEPPQPLVHLGPRNTRRRTSVATDSSSVHTTLTTGMRLLDSLGRAVDDTGCTSAQAELMGGTLSRVSYCVPAICTDGSVPLTYSATREAETPAQLLTASVTFGQRDGERFMHCHAAWMDARGNVSAGHLWPETLIGDVPVYAVIHTLPDADLISSTDPETSMPTFVPTARPLAADTPRSAGSRAVMSRVGPGEDLTQAAVEICREYGFAQAVVRASLGSLVGARLRQGNEMQVVDGPGTEVVSVAGRLHVRGDTVDGELATILVDRHGQVHAGQLVRGHNIVAITFELFITEEC
ncbi:PCC domain-containing protein [Streptomyces phaeochromogenes]|uniref:PCC domain-containing protein n=1 Tax=Streptomyces phaeochromogenes TaxID=1923 RepID=UPI002DD8AB87|nr:DUF296 domain-containing protein [Streptomyces phaeochromogenes]WRZ34586.1 DNA-binding protein [Streptomyces phaeochromogenes]